MRKVPQVVEHLINVWILHLCKLKVLDHKFITLLLKVKDVKKIQQHWNICVLNCWYKWIAKVLTLKLALTLWLKISRFWI